ncbi:MAG: DUF493 family protein [Bdellovibrio sp.]|nr:DUF493 family protein [Bdellovibrio sp.]
MPEFQKLRVLLEKNYTWPALYLFKFIIPIEKEPEFKRILGLDITIKEYEVRASGKGKYLSFTFRMNMVCSDEVIEVYQRAIAIKGVLSL